MPRLHRQLGAKTHGDRSEARFQHLLHALRGKHVPDLPLPMAVDATTKGMTGVKASRRMLPDLHPDRFGIPLPPRQGRRHYQYKEKRPVVHDPKNSDPTE